MTRTLIVAVALFLSGCASYRYDIAADDGKSSQVLKDKDLVLPSPPVDLRLRQVSSRCVVLITNPTTQPVSIDGSGSTIVDPKGQSRAIASQLIAPQSFVKLILPPMRDADPSGPAVHFGLGFIVNSSVERTPQYLDVNPALQEYWEWDGVGAIRLILQLRQGEQTSHLAYTIRRTQE